jgi:endonuclease YncB( thermonuclease family)
VEASAFVNNTVGGNRVVVTQMEKDRYGRRIGAIGYPSEHGISSLGVGLIRYGLAWHYKKYAPDNKQYSDDEKLAQKEEIGLWSGSNPIAPWDWRKGVR